jgi:poly-gamma-glutamate synthesis protein (capsule biosynthesis protein)
MTNKKTSIILVGDICPTKDTTAIFKSQNPKKLLNNMVKDIEQADLSIANLEFPLTNKKKGILKTGPILRGDEDYIHILKNAGFDVLSLANNHIKDCGEEGVLDTIRICKEHEVDILGAGSNLKEAKKPLVKEINGIKVGIMAFAEQEFNIATENSAGSNYLDLYYDFDAIKEFKTQVDYLIILYHGGIEYYKYPSPLLQKKCRKLIESGADLVSCQHSHCIGTFENYKKGQIIYGQGNFVFGYRNNKPSWNEGLLLNIVLEKNEINIIEAQITYKLVESTTDSGIVFSNKEKNIKRLREFEEDSSQLNKKFIDQNWMKFCSERQAIYFPLIFGFNRILIHLNKLLKNSIVRLFYNRKKRIITQNIIRCESHHEVMMTVLNMNVKKKR